MSNILTEIQHQDLTAKKNPKVLDSDSLDSFYASDSYDVEVNFSGGISDFGPTYRTQWAIDFSTPADTWILEESEGGEDSEDVEKFKKDSEEDSTNTSAHGATGTSSEISENFMLKFSRKRRTSENEQFEPKIRKIEGYQPKLEISQTFELNFIEQQQIMEEYEFENPMEIFDWIGLECDLSPVFVA